jgi:hypothetical protein
MWMESGGLAIYYYAALLSKVAGPQIKFNTWTIGRRRKYLIKGRNELPPSLPATGGRVTDDHGQYVAGRGMNQVAI